MFGVVNAYGFCVDARPSGKEAEGKAELLIGQTLQPWHVVEGVFTWAKK